MHLLIVDLFPAGRRDPQGIHKAIWDRLHDEPFTLPPDKPLTVVAYAVGTETVAYVEPVAVGDSLPDMPVFITGDGTCLAPWRRPTRRRGSSSPRLSASRWSRRERLFVATANPRIFPAAAATRPQPGRRSAPAWTFVSQQT